jgi:hypothetical protein
VSDDLPHTRTDEHKSDSGTDTAVRETRDSRASERLDVVFDLLRSAPRRYLLYYLYEMGADWTTYTEAATAVANYEAATGDVTTAPSRETIRQQLHHVHLPRLEAAGVVECDPRQEYVRFNGHDELGVWLQVARAAELE